MAGAVTPLLASGTASAVSDGGGGNIEICKTLAPPPITVNTNASFTFTISGVSGTTSVAAGTCSAPIWVSGGSHTITETSGTWFKVTSITELPGQSYMGTPNLSAGSVSVNVQGGATDTVTYTNALVTGYVEVCKNAVTGSGLTGSFSFGLSGQDGYASTVTVPVGACSNPIQVPAGSLNTTESGTNLYVTGITATLGGTSTSELGPSNDTAGTATVTVLASSDASTQTDVTYTNDVVSLKVCKAFDGTAPTGVNSAPFTETATNTTAGPNTAPGPFSVPNGTVSNPVCSQPVAYAPGTAVTVTEGIVPGTKVEHIITSGAATNLGTDAVGTSLTGRTASITLGTSVTASGSPLDEAVVEFVNEVAAPGQLKICKQAGTVPGPPVGNSFSFSVTGVTGATIVPVGSCAVVGGAGTPVLFPYNSTVNITEAGSPSNQAIGVSTVPTFVSEIVGGTATNTTELVQPAPPTLGAVGASSNVNVVIGEANTTEVTFTNVDPPAGVTIPTSPIITVPNPGGIGVTSGVGVSIPGVPSVSSIASTIPSVISSSTGSLTPASTTNGKSALGSTLVKPLTAKQKAALKKADIKTLGNVEANIARYQKLVKQTSGTIKKLAERRLVELRAEAAGLKAQIRKL